MTDPLIVEPLLFAAMGSVLSGASFGDMNSPFSVTFLISTASAETSVSGHFKSQAGYSLLAFATTIVAGYLLLMLGIKPYLSIAAGALLIGIAFLGLNRTK
jgi:Na+/H+ antiporter NhaC